MNIPFELLYRINIIYWHYDYSNSIQKSLAIFGKRYAIQKHPWCKKSEAKSEAPVTSIFCMRLKDVMSGRGQGLLRFNHFVYAAIYNHVQTDRNNACRQTIET